MKISSNFLIGSGLYFTIFFSLSVVAQQPSQQKFPGSPQPGGQKRTETLFLPPESDGIDYNKVKPHLFIEETGNPIAPEDIFSTMAQIILGVENLRKKSFKQQPNPRLVSLNDFRKHLKEGLIQLSWVESNNSLEDRFRYFQMIAASFRMIEKILPVLESTQGTYYDFVSGDMFFFEWMKTGNFHLHCLRALNKVLINQLYDVKTLQSQYRGNNDARYALNSLLEGDSIFSQIEFEMLKKNVEVTNYEIGIDIEREAWEKIDVLAKKEEIPRSLLCYLFLPMVYGVKFVEYGRRFYSLPRLLTLYGRLPNSMEKIIHPEKYFKKNSKDDPTRLILLPEIDQIVNKQRWRVKERTNFGEFFIYLIMVDLFGREEAERVSQGWDGDIYAMYSKNMTERALVFFSEWDSEVDCNEAFLGFQRYYVEGFYKGRRYKVLESKTDYFQLGIDEEQLLIKKKGRGLLIVQGFSDVVTKQISEVFGR